MRELKGVNIWDLHREGGMLVFSCGYNRLRDGTIGFTKRHKGTVMQKFPGFIEDANRYLSAKQPPTVFVGWEQRVALMPCRHSAAEAIDLELLREQAAALRWAARDWQAEGLKIFLVAWYSQWNNCTAVMEPFLHDIVTVVWDKGSEIKEPEASRMKALPERRLAPEPNDNYGEEWFPGRIKE